MTDTTPTDTETPDDVSFLFDDHEIDWDDGTFWFVGWSHVWNSYFADRVYDEEFIDEDDHTFRSCPGPEVGYSNNEVVKHRPAPVQEVAGTP